MSEAAEAGATARLEGLAAATKEYAMYSRRMFGIANVITGAWLLASTIVRWGVSQRPGEILTLLTPLLWMALMSRARAYYQRHGEVLEPEPDWYPFPARGYFLGFVYLCSVIAIWEEFARPRQGLGFFALAALVAIPVFAVRATRGILDASTTAVVTQIAILPVGTFGNWLRAAFAVVLVVTGAWQHRRYRGLERRLAALRRPAA